MARIVCQVVPRSDRLTFIWSEGAASFEPYHLAGAEQAHFDAVAAAALGALGGGTELAALGHRLYRALFRLDAPDGADAQAIARWLQELHGQGQVESVEFLGDAPGRVPWNLLHGNGTASSWDAFWGAQFNLAAGRRTNPLRFTPPFVKPAALLAADAALLDQVSGPERARLDAWADERLIVSAADQLAGQLRQRTPDVLVLLARVEDGALQVGGQRVTPAQMREWIGEARDGNPNPLIFLGAAGTPEQAPAWERWLAAVTADLDGLVTNIVPLAPAAAIASAVAAAERFLQGRQPLGAALAEVRTSLAALGPAVTAFCPPSVRVAESEDAEPGPAPSRQPLPEYPYCPLRPCGPEERPLFFGREDETLRLAALLDQDTTAAVILHSAPAAGKTSLVQAGLWPYLEQECVGYRLLCDRNPDDAPTAESDYPPVVLRPGSDLAGQLAEGLFAFCSQPLSYTTPAGKTVTVDLPALLGAHVGSSSSTAIQPPPAPTAGPEQVATGIAEPGHAPPEAEPEPGPGPSDLWLALREDPARLGRLLDDLTRRLPFELVLTIDEGEDLLTLARSVTERERRQQALDMLLALAESPARCKIVLLLRTEYFGQLAGLLPVRAGRALWKEFFLEELSATAMTDAVLGPTSRDEILYTDEVPYAKYGFSYEEGFAPQLVSEVAAEARAGQYGVLSLLQVVGAMLYDQRVVQRRQDIIRAADLRQIGGVRGALARYVGQRIDRLSLPSAARAGLRRLMQRLYTRQTDGRITRDLVAARALKDMWQGSVPIEQAVNTAAEQAGLFAIDPLLVGGQSGLYVSLAHDSVAQASRLGETDRGGTGTKRSGVIDTLWIMIPLAMLAAAVTFYFTRSHYAAELEDYKEQIKTPIEEFKARLEEKFLAGMVPQYRGQLAQAERLLDSGNALGARQLLLQPAPALAADARAEMRGWEWYYLWNRATGAARSYEGHLGTVHAVAVTADGQLAASASADGKVRLWRLGSGLSAGLIDIGKPLYAVALSRDGTQIAAAGASKDVYLWSLPAFNDDTLVVAANPKALVGHEGDVLALAFDKDGQTLASAGVDRTVILWDVKGGQLRHRLKGHDARVAALAFAPDGKTLASGGAESRVLLWTVAAGKQAHAIEKTGFASVSALAFAPDGNALAVGGAQAFAGIEVGAVRTWPLKADTTPGEPSSATMQHGQDVLALAFLPGGKAFASAGKDANIRIWDAATGQPIGQRVGHLGWVAGLAVTGDGVLVSAGYDRSVKAWDNSATRAGQVLPAHAGGVQALAFGLLTKDRALLASGGKDGVVKLWDPDSGAALGDLPGHAGAVTAIAFAGHRMAMLAVGTWDDKGGGEIKLWELEPEKKGPAVKGKLLHTLAGHKGGITALAFSPRRPQLASASGDKTAMLWNTDTGKPAHTLAGHLGEVRCLCYAAEGSAVCTGGTDRMVRVWNAESGRLEFGPFPGHTDVIEGVDFQFRKFPQANGPVALFITAGRDQLLRVLTPAESRLDVLGTLHVANHPIMTLAHTPSRLLLTGGWDGTVRLWDLELHFVKEESPQIEFRERFTFSGHTGPVRAVAMSPDETTLASGSHDGTIRLWRGLNRPAPAAPAKKAK